MGLEEINEKIANFREELEESYQSQKAQLLDYPIFMAIAEKIGYDATGKNINQNDLDDISHELRKFIDAVQNGTDRFFL